MAPLLPKLRGHFAEFLNHSSPDRLGILYLTTCVGLGYGPCMHSLEAFLGSIGSPSSPQTATHHVSASWNTDLPMFRPTRLHQDNHRLAELPSCVTPSLDYYRIRSHAPQHSSIRRLHHALWVVSINCLIMGAHARVREYQPVVHRLRLSASP